MTNTLNIVLLWILFHCMGLTVSDNTTLYCHKCEESFKQWDPYTSCQIYANTTPLVKCLPSESYCMVQKTSIKGMTTNIKRECAEECYYGCRAKNFGITMWYCTSCCRTSGCNVDNGATQISLTFVELTMVLLYLLTKVSI